VKRLTPTWRIESLMKLDSDQAGAEALQVAETEVGADEWSIGSRTEPVRATGGRTRWTNKVIDVGLTARKSAGSFLRTCRRIDAVGGRMEIVGTALAEMTMPQISPLAGEPIERADAERLAGVLKALADPARLRLLSLIQSATDGEACVCDLTAPLGLSQPTVSHHLKVLRSAGLVSATRRGTYIWYAVVPEQVAALRAVLAPSA
jgi:ArsR family transcriptional regulator